MSRELVFPILLIAALAAVSVVLIGRTQTEERADPPPLEATVTPASEGSISHAPDAIRGITEPGKEPSRDEADAPVPASSDGAGAMPSAGDESRLIELALHVASLDLQIERANAQLLAEAEPLWEDYWNSGEYEVVDAISAEFAMTEDGRPKPMQVKRVGKETRVVVLPEEVYPEIWTGLENLTRMTTERQAIETELRLLRESLVATGR